MLWLGIGEQQKYAIVFMGCFASILVYTTDATMRVDPILRRAASNLGASRLQVMRYVILPGALPDILSGLKVVLAIAWTCVISAEMVGANSGLGFRIWTAKEWSDTGQVLVGMICISVTVLILDILFRGIERLLLPWRQRVPGT
jgi:taurine transport system permease protein